MCQNCLEPGETVKPMPVGHDNGTQRDPWRYEVALCEPCRGALLAGKFDVLHERFSAQVTVRRNETTGVPGSA